jgi:hypothetical protein
MAVANHERVRKALDLLRAGLTPFVEREFKAKFGDGGASEIRDALVDTRLGANKSETIKAARLVIFVKLYLPSGRRSRGTVNAVSVRWKLRCQPARLPNADTGRN